eukprot:gene16747-23020_t
MAPKAAKKGDDPQQDLNSKALKEETEESSRLLQKSLEVGMLSKEPARKCKSLRLSKVLSKCNGCDVVKKSTVRKGRYMVVLNFQIAPAAAGKLGTLTRLDTRNPVMYIDFPNGGRLKVLGTLVFPKSKYMMLRPAGNTVLCEDVFESMIVFSEAWWVGSKEENPEEKRLPMPSSLAQTDTDTKLHQNYNFEYGAANKGEAEAAPKASQQDDMLTSQDMASQLPSQRLKRVAAAVAHRKLPELGSDDEDEDMEVDEEGEKEGVGRAKVAARPSTKRMHDDDDDDEEYAGGGGSGEALVPRNVSVRTTKKPSYTDVEDDEGEDVKDEEEEEEEEEDMEEVDDDSDRPLKKARSASAKTVAKEPASTHTTPKTSTKLAASANRGATTSTGRGKATTDPKPRAKAPASANKRQKQATIDLASSDDD